MQEQAELSDVLQPLADDMLRGAYEIAEFIFGSRANRRQIYYLTETSRLPVFRLGSVLCARRSILMQWIAAQERQVLTAPLYRKSERT